MSTISFTLKQKRLHDSDKYPLTVYAIYVNGRKFKIERALKDIQVPLKYWDQKRGQIKSGSIYPGKEEINKTLLTIKVRIKELEAESFSRGTPIKKSEVIECFNNFNVNANRAHRKTFFVYFDQYIQKSERKINKDTGRPLRKGTLKTYQVTKNLLEKYAEEKGYFGFDDVNLDFYNEFVEWCEKLNHRQNYIGRHIKIITTIMNAAFDEGITKNIEYKKKAFKMLKEDVEEVYLNEEELRKIEEVKLKDEKLNQIRDIFLIGAHTGLRVSDYTTIKKEDITLIEGRSILKINETKTGQNVLVPMKNIVANILKKYEYKLPEILKQKINLGIKRIAEEAEIDNPIKRQFTKGGIIHKEVIPKYQMIKTHTARRSFCTNAYLAGMNSLDIMAISGHRSEKNFLNYIKVTAEQRAVKISKHPFFND